MRDICVISELKQHSSPIKTICATNVVLYENVFFVNRCGKMNAAKNINLKFK